MGNELFQARVDDDFATEVHEYRDENHMSKSETVRKALRELVQEDNTQDTMGEAVAEAEADARGPDTSTLLERLAAPSMVLNGLGLVVLTLVSWGLTSLYLEAGRTALALLTFGIGGASLLSGTTIVVVAALAQLALAKPLSGLVPFTTREGEA